MNTNASTMREIKNAYVHAGKQSQSQKKGTTSAFTGARAPWYVYYVLAYLQLAKDVLENGDTRTDRTGTGTVSVFGRQLRFDLQRGFPLLTTKKVHWHSVLHELLWFLQGSSNIAYLKQHKVRIWDEWADENGDLGPVYGVQWRSWPTPSGEVVDQLANVVEALKVDPHSRRHLVSAWNVGSIKDMKLPPCHYAFQFYVDAGSLSCMFNMRSTDVFLGLPFNIASYAALTHTVAATVGLQVGDLVCSLGDVHIYVNHIAQIEEQLRRQPLALPKLTVRPQKNIDLYTAEDFTLADYVYHPPIKGAVSV